jgi:hypothetical protein
MNLLAVCTLCWGSLLAGADSGFIALFNGKDLTGWRGDPKYWTVENGVITGTTDNERTEQNTFLVYETPFGDFHLRMDVRLRNGNSGIQFRSKVLDEKAFIVAGYQADFSEDGDRSAWGNFYEERGRGRKVMKTMDEGWQKGKSLVRHHDWNTIEVIAEGSRIRVFLNGTQTIDTADHQASEGVIALQLHRGDPMRVEFRNIEIQRLGGRK